MSTLGTLGIYRQLDQAPPGVRPDAHLPGLAHSNGYFKTKWVAEQLALTARARGLPVTIYRPGLVRGDSVTGQDSTTAGQFFYSLVRGCLELCIAPSLPETSPQPTGSVSMEPTPIPWRPSGSGLWSLPSDLPTTVRHMAMWRTRHERPPGRA